MYDDAFLVGVAANASDLKMTNHKFLNVPWGVGIRKGDVATKRWVDAAIRGMKARDQFWGILRRTIPRRFYHALQEERSKPEGDPEVSAGGTARVELPDLGERRDDGRVAASQGRPLVFHARMRILASFEWSFIWDNRDAALAGVQEHDQGVRDRDRGVLRDRPRARRRAGSPDPGAEPARRGVRRADPEHADSRPDLPPLLHAARRARRDQWGHDPGHRRRRHPARDLHGRLALDHDLGRCLQHRELPRRVRGGAEAPSRSRLCARFHSAQDVSERDAPDRWANRASFDDQHVHLGSEEHLADARHRLPGTDDRRLQHPGDHVSDLRDVRGPRGRLSRHRLDAVRSDPRARATSSLSRRRSRWPSSPTGSAPSRSTCSGRACRRR